MNIAQCHIFNKGSRYSADNGGVARVGIKYIDVADEDAFHCAHGRSLRAAHPGSQPQEDGGVDNIAHRDVTDDDIFQFATVHCFQGSW